MLNEEFIEFLTTSRFYGPIFIIICAIIIFKVVNLIISKAAIKGKTELEIKKRKTMVLLFKNIIKYIIIIISAVMILNIYGINTTSVIAGLGIAGIVVGLALQDALKDVIGGINIILEDYYVLGDTVKYNDFIGTVTHFGLKSTKIKSVTGEVLVLSNRSVDKIINLSQKSSVINFEIPTSIEEDSKKVRKALEEVITKAEKIDNVDSKGCEYIGIDKIEPKLITYVFRVKCKQGCQFELRRIILEMVKEAYEKANLKFS